MNQVVTFGEIMLRLTPPGYLRFIQTSTFEASYGGGEANVAVSLANFGVKTTFVTKLPGNSIGDAAVKNLQFHGVDVSRICRGGDRIGTYYLEKGASQRPSKVIYDRKHSAISEAEPGDFDWSQIFKGAEWFHFTGITPALSDQAAQLCLQACKEAKKQGLTVSCDLNFRKNLWSREMAQKVMSQLMEYVDVCIANEEDAEQVFGIKAENSEVTSGKLNHQSYQQVAAKLKELFHFKTVAITLRESISASDNRWAAMMYDGEHCFFSKQYEVHIIDRVGGGDSFGAGLIYCLLNKEPLQEALEFAVASSCLKHSIEGDFNQVSGNEVRALMMGDGSGRVQR